MTQLVASYEPVVAAPRNDITPSVRHVTDVADLAVIFEPSLNIAVLKRQLPQSVASEALVLARESGLRCRVIIEDTAKLLETFIEALPNTPSLAADAARWCELLMDITGAQRVGVRLERVENAMCPRFHSDQVTLRLVTTYVGFGTEYVDSRAVDRRWLARPELTLEEADARLISDPSARGQCQVGDVILLKGDAWPGHEGQGAVHRSPHACANEPRVVMTIDALA